MTDLEIRVAYLEKNVDTLHSSLQHTNTQLGAIGQALTSLARIEERQIASKDKLEEINTGQDGIFTRLRLLEHSIPDNLGKRISAIESQMPGLQESRKWVVSGLVGACTLLAANLIHSVLK
jgi:hypothetical protein